MTSIDWIVFAGLLTGLLLVGAWARRYVRSVADFVVADRKMRKYLGLSTSSAEGVGLVSIAFVAEQGFTGGLGYVWMTLLSIAIFVPIFGIYGFGIRRFRATRVQTIPQYHEMRFSKGVRVCVGIAMFIGGVLNMAIFPLVSSRFLIAYLHLPETVQLAGIEWSTFHLIMAALIGVSMMTAMFGGMVTVIITDYVQSVVLALAMFIITGLIVWRVSVVDAYDTLSTEIGPSAFNPFLEGNYGPMWVLFFVLSGLFGALSFPPSTAKTASADNTNTVRKMALIGGLFSSGRTLMILVWGVGALTVMGALAPNADGQVDYSRYATAEFASSLAPIGIAGLCAAGLLFAYITTDNSYYLAWSAILINDVVAPLRKKPLSQRHHLMLLRTTIAGVAAFLLFWGIVYKPPESILSYLYLTGAIFTSAGVLTIFGLYWKRANTAGAYSAVAICLIVPMTDLIGKQILGEQYPLEGHESGLLTLGLAIGAFILCGLLSRSGEKRWHNYGHDVRIEDEQRRRKS